jgi:Ca2+-transporting ATPase
MAFEAEPGDPDLMRRPPRRVDAPLFDRRMLVVSILQGASLLAATLFAFRLGLAHTGADASARAMAFTTLIAGNAGLILVNRTWRGSVLSILSARNLAAWAVIAGAVATLALALAVPFFRSLFRFGTVALHDLALGAAVGLGSLAWFEILKAVKPAWLRER